MKSRVASIIVVFLAFALLAIPARAGGWVVISLTQFPTEVIQNKTLEIEFAIRQHGVSLTSDFGTPFVYAKHIESGERFTVEAVETDREGYFTAELLFPQSGTWNWSIDAYGEPSMAQTMPALTVAQASGALSQTHSTPQSLAVSAPAVLSMIGMMTLVGAGIAFFSTKNRWAVAVGTLGILLAVAGLSGVVQRPAAAAPSTSAQTSVSTVPMSESELGKALFVAKGCVVCHAHSEARLGFTGIQTDIGPDLSNTLLTADYIRVWLKDPAEMKPATQMPNLELKKTEIDALATFLTINQ